MHGIGEELAAVKAASRKIALLDEKTRQQVLMDLARRLRASSSSILAANQKDRNAMDAADPKYDRLLLTKERLAAIASDVENVAGLSCPNTRVLEDRQLCGGLELKKVTVPLGVVAVIYESRPNVTIDVFSLCFKSGNACVLKGGKEALHSNRIFCNIIGQSLREFALPEHAVYLLPTARDALATLLDARDWVDVCIPRGGRGLINYVRDHARIPVIETGAGIVHSYFDESGSLEKGRRIIDNAKTRRLSVCNALDTLIIHEKRLSDLPVLVTALGEKEVELLADKRAYQALQAHYPRQLLHPARKEDFGHEFLSAKMAVKTVSNQEEAIAHIQDYSSAHSEAIIAEDTKAIEKFLAEVDAAAVYVNTSTAFTDGAFFGLGAEIGISTQKLHARGPMALDALRSYKWIVRSNGQIRD